MRGGSKISFLADTVVEEILGDHCVEGVRVRDARTVEGRVLPWMDSSWP